LIGGKVIKLLERDYFKNKDFTAYIIKSMQEALSYGLLDGIDDEQELKDMKEYIETNYDFLGINCDNYKEQYVSSKILHLNITDIGCYPDILGEKLISLLKSINAESITIILDTKCDWFSQNNNYKPVRKSLKELREIVGKKNYYGAFEVDFKHLKQMIEIVFWLGRCNASLPYIHLICEKQRVSFMICKYGNLHVDTYSKEIDKSIEESYLESGFISIDNENEFLEDEFKGRKIKI
jgi:hypothetical protein